MTNKVFLGISNHIRFYGKNIMKFDRTFTIMTITTIMTIIAAG
ncbi:hypothetical protein [Exercitatus varius]|nr:hypothetical protein [Exercitatus varius]MDG2943151.1 hypothetical protein [Exercitatus varius]